jgi:hypothetical protein
MIREGDGVNDTSRFDGMAGKNGLRVCNREYPVKNKW